MEDLTAFGVEEVRVIEPGGVEFEISESEEEPQEHKDATATADEASARAVEEEIRAARKAQRYYNMADGINNNTLVLDPATSAVMIPRQVLQMVHTHTFEAHTLSCAYMYTPQAVNPSVDLDNMDDPFMRLIWEFLQEHAEFR